MGRFFNTAPAQFVEDFLYKPNYELIGKVIEQKQKEYDTLLQQLSLFGDLNVEHLNGPDDVENLNKIKDYYNNQANDLAEAIKNNKLNAQSYTKNIQALANELKKDMSEGDLSRIRNSALAAKAWEEDNKNMKDKHPELFQTARNKFMSDYLQNGGNSLDRGWSGFELINPMDWEKLNKSMADIKAQIRKSDIDSQSGFYIVKNGNKTEYLDPNRLDHYALSIIMQDPANMMALQQAQRLGMGQYFDKDGRLDWNAPGFAGIREANKARAYSNTEVSRGLKSDPVALHFDNREWEKYKMSLSAQKEQKEKADKLYEKARETITDPNKGKEEKKAAEQYIKYYEGYSDTKNIKPKAYKSLEDIADNINSPSDQYVGDTFIRGLEEVIRAQDSSPIMKNIVALAKGRIEQRMAKGENLTKKTIEEEFNRADKYFGSPYTKHNAKKSLVQYDNKIYHYPPDGGRVVMSPEGDKIMNNKNLTTTQKVQKLKKLFGDKSTEGYKSVLNYISNNQENLFRDKNWYEAGIDTNKNTVPYNTMNNYRITVQEFTPNPVNAKVFEADLMKDNNLLRNLQFDDGSAIEADEKPIRTYLLNGSGKSKSKPSIAVEFQNKKGKIRTGYLTISNNQDPVNNLLFQHLVRMNDKEYLRLDELGNLSRYVTNYMSSNSSQNRLAPEIRNLFGLDDTLTDNRNGKFTITYMDGNKRESLEGDLNSIIMAVKEYKKANGK